MSVEKVESIETLQTKEIIGKITDLLDRARAGEIKELMTLAITKKGHVVDYTGTTDTYDRLKLLEILKAYTLKRIIE